MQHIVQEVTPGYFSQTALERVLVIATKPVNRIVITHSIERVHRKPKSVEPLEAEMALGNPNLALVVIDATGDQAHLDAIFSQLTELRNKRDCGMPRVLLIESTSSGAGLDTTALPVDAVINRPITPDKIQTLVDRLLKGVATSPCNH